MALIKSLPWSNTSSPTSSTRMRAKNEEDTWIVDERSDLRNKFKILYEKTNKLGLSWTKPKFYLSGWSNIDEISLCHGSD